MAAAAEPFTQWATATGVQAEQAASQLRSAAAAFETAHAAITPPTAVAANRTQLSSLIATNLLGQNAARIAAVEAAYLGMWAQNTQAMYGYAGSASSATTLTPFNQPPPTTNPAGQSAAATTAAASPGQGLVSEVLQGLSSSGSSASSGTTSLFGVPVPQSLMTDIGTTNTLLGPVNFFSASFRSLANGIGMSVSLFRLWADGVLYAPLAGLTGATSPVGGATLPAGVLAGTAGSASKAVLASAANAAPIGRLSVPPTWTQAVPAAGLANNPFWLAGAEDLWEAAPAASAGGGTGLDVGQLAAMAAAGMAMRPVVGSMLKVPPRRFKMPRHSGGG